MYFLQRFHDLPQKHHQLGSKCPNIGAHGGHLPFQPAHNLSPSPLMCFPYRWYANEQTSKEEQPRWADAGSHGVSTLSMVCFKLSMGQSLCVEVGRDPIVYPSSQCRQPGVNHSPNLLIKLHTPTDLYFGAHFGDNTKKYGNQSPEKLGSFLRCVTVGQRLKEQFVITS